MFTADELPASCDAAYYPTYPTVANRPLSPYALAG